MTPPEVLLEKALKQAKQLMSVSLHIPQYIHIPRTQHILMQEVGVAVRQEEGVTNTLDCCIRCTALARIVYGDFHWVLAKAHIQLGKAYLDLKGYPCMPAMAY